MTPRERDPLSWDGDDDPTLDTGAAADDAADTRGDDERSRPLPTGYTAVGRGADQLGSGAGASTVTPSHNRDSKPEQDAGHATAADDGVSEGEGTADEEPRGMGNAALIALGVLGGVYLLYTIGWIVGGLRLQDVAQFLVAPVAYQVALWIAVAAPAIWFGVTVLLTRHSRTWVRFVWLGAGVVLLVPWPFAMIGAIGQ